MRLHFIQFLNTELSQVVNIQCQERPEYFYYIQSVLGLLMSWQCKISKNVFEVIHSQRIFEKKIIFKFIVVTVPADGRVLLALVYLRVQLWS